MDKGATYRTNQCAVKRWSSLGDFSSQSLHRPVLRTCCQERARPRPGEKTAWCSSSSGSCHFCALCAAPRTPWFFSLEVSAGRQHSEVIRPLSNVSANFKPGTYCWIFALVLEFRDALLGDVFCGHGGVNALRTVLPVSPLVEIFLFFPPRNFIHRWDCLHRWSTLTLMMERHFHTPSRQTCRFAAATDHERRCAN